MIYAVVKRTFAEVTLRFAYLVHALFIFCPRLSGKLVCPASIISEGLAEHGIDELCDVDGLTHTFGLPQTELFSMLVG